MSGKKILSIILMCTMIISVVAITGCGEKNKKDNAKNDVKTQNEKKEKEDKKLYLGDKITKEEIPDESIGDTALVLKQNLNNNVTIKDGVEVIQDGYENFIYLELEKNKTLGVDIYTDMEYIGSTTLRGGNLKIKLNGKGAEVGDHEMYIIGYDTTDDSKKSLERITYFRTFKYQIV